MERMYRALFWLAGAGVAVELLVLAINLMNAVSAAQSGQSGTWLSYTGSPDALLSFIWVPTIISIAEYLNEGAALMGAALAWADRRRNWFIALAILAAAATVFPLGFEFLLSRPWFFLVHPRVAAWLGNNAMMLFNMASLTPSALALAFAWRGRAGERQAARLDADAALEITRSPI